MIFALEVIMSIKFEELKTANLIVDKVYEAGQKNNFSGEVLSKLMMVGNQGGFRYRVQNNQKDKCAYYVLESTQNQIDWIDDVDLEQGTVTYYGDNRVPGKDLHDKKLVGNNALKVCFELLQQGKRIEIPPFFYFEREGIRNRKFVGLLVPGDDECRGEDQLIAIWRSREKLRYQNYKARFSILDVNMIDRRWLNDLLDGIGYSSRYAPKAWKKWIKTGKAKKLKADKTVQYRSKAKQLPENELEWEMLNLIHEYFSISKKSPYYFEKCAIEIAKMMDGNIVSCKHTRFTKDGGRDAVGKYRIGHNNEEGIKIDFALEAKCYKPGKDVGVKELSRLISRLRFRQFGILVTTSTLGNQAYKELKEDQHPVVLISGGDIIKILEANGIIGNEKLSVWLSKFEH